MVKDKEEAKSEINSMMESQVNEFGSKDWYCSVCNYSNCRKSVVFQHVDSRHFEGNYNCEYCLKLFPTQQALAQHINFKHKK